MELIRRVLTASPEPISAASARGFWDELQKRRGAVPSSPLDLAVMGGFSADRVGFAFLAGYEAAVRVLFEMDNGAIGTLSVTEEGGNKPRAIETRLESTPTGYTLTGEKRWATLAPIGDVLFVIARAAVRADGRPHLVAVRVPRETAGVDVREMPTPPFIPEISHAALTFAGATVGADAVLPGDAYNQYVKPFRTAEDLHVHASLLGYLIGVARRFGWPRSVLEGLAASLAAVHQLAVADLSAAEVHVALTGLLATDAARLDSYDPFWEQAHDEDRTRWHRDRQLFQVAGSAREARRERAWQRLSEAK